jgi:hypothetical protein
MIASILTGLFYLFGIIFVIRQIEFVYDPIGEMEGINIFKQFQQKYREARKISREEALRYEAEYVALLQEYKYDLLLAIWVFVGLLSSQWLIFLVMILLDLFIINPIKRVASQETLIKVVFWDSLLSCLLGILILVNKYHLHINFFEILFGW